MRRYFNTEGPIDAKRHYFVAREAEVCEFLRRVREGRYIVIFAPRQTGKTSFFRMALQRLVDEAPSFLPVQLTFENYSDFTKRQFYETLDYRLKQGLREQLTRLVGATPTLPTRLERCQIQNPEMLQRFFDAFAEELPEQKMVLVIDEFDGIPSAVLPNFLHTLRVIYHLPLEKRALWSVGLVGIKSVTQLNPERSISPFNIARDFELPNFTVEQVQDLMSQYTAETGQPFETAVVARIHEKTTGQPFLVNRLLQILTEELDIPLSAPITEKHFEVAYQRLLAIDNVHFQHLRTNALRQRSFRQLLLRIITEEPGVPFDFNRQEIQELSTYGLIRPNEQGFAIIQNPTYQNILLRALPPLQNGLEDRYLPPSMAGFTAFVTPAGFLDMEAVLLEFSAFLQRVGFEVFRVQETPKEFVGQSLLMSYLDLLARQIGAHVYREIPTGRGRMDVILIHGVQKYVVETKLWRGEASWEAGKRQLAAYLTTEGVSEGYYVVFDLRGQLKEIRHTQDVTSDKRIVSFQIPLPVSPATEE